jgi:hypothetical protein
MLIVNKPQEIQKDEREDGGSNTSILDVDFLEFDDLEIDYLAEDELEFTELDINYLDVNFLEDLLNIIEDVNELDQTETLLKADIDLKGTQVGYDSNTQINTFMTDNLITFYKTLEDTVRLDLDKQNAYTIILIQDGKSTQIVVNGGGNSTIKITQGN